MMVQSRRRSQTICWCFIVEQQILGFRTCDEGKLMGLQSYGEANKRVEEILSDEDLFLQKINIVKILFFT